MSLESLRERNKDGKLDRLLKAASRTSKGNDGYSNNEQEETYYPERDKNGNGSCIFRFLPGLESEDYPYYLERFQHGFQMNNKWYIEFCPTTLNNNCPVCTDNRDIIREYGKWDDCPPNIQDDLRKRGRSSGFRAGNYCNILVIKDPANPENEGKVHRFKFGKFISDMIFDMAQPQDDGLGSVPDPIDVFDLLEGANFKFIIRKKKGRADYKSSEFEKQSKCPEFDESTQFPILKIRDEKLFKPYEELSGKFNKVMNTKRTYKSAEDLVDKKEGQEPDKQAEESKQAESHEPQKEPNDVPSNGDDDNMAYFQGIANDINV